MPGDFAFEASAAKRGRYRLRGQLLWGPLIKTNSFD